MLITDAIKFPPKVTLQRTPKPLSADGQPVTSTARAEGAKVRSAIAGVIIANTFFIYILNVKGFFLFVKSHFKKNVDVSMVVTYLVKLKAILWISGLLQIKVYKRVTPKKVPIVFIIKNAKNATIKPISAKTIFCFAWANFCLSPAEVIQFIPPQIINKSARNTAAI